MRSWWNSEVLLWIMFDKIYIFILILYLQWVQNWILWFCSEIIQKLFHQKSDLIFHINSAESNNFWIFCDKITLIIDVNLIIFSNCTSQNESMFDISVFWNTEMSQQKIKNQNWLQKDTFCLNFFQKILILILFQNVHI